MAIAPSSRCRGPPMPGCFPSRTLRRGTSTRPKSSVRAGLFASLTARSVASSTSALRFRGTKPLCSKRLRPPNRVTQSRPKRPSKIRLFSNSSTSRTNTQNLTWSRRSSGSRNADLDWIASAMTPNRERVFSGSSLLGTCLGLFPELNAQPMGWYAAFGRTRGGTTRMFAVSYRSEEHTLNSSHDELSRMPSSA